MSDDIVDALRAYAEDWQLDRSIIDRAADEIVRLRALLETSVVLAQPGALSVNCVRGSVSCRENKRLRARVAELERQPPGIVSAGCQCPPGANAQCENHWCPRKTTSFRVTCGAAP